MHQKTGSFLLFQPWITRDHLDCLSHVEITYGGLHVHQCAFRWQWLI
jgi:hypothetical protein